MLFYGFVEFPFDVFSILHHLLVDLYLLPLLLQLLHLHVFIYDAKQIHYRQLKSIITLKNIKLFRLFHQNFILICKLGLSFLILPRNALFLHDFSQALCHLV